MAMGRAIQNEHKDLNFVVDDSQLFLDAQEAKKGVAQSQTKRCISTIKQAIGLELEHELGL